MLGNRVRRRCVRLLRDRLDLEGIGTLVRYDQGLRVRLGDLRLEHDVAGSRWIIGRFFLRLDYECYRYSKGNVILFFRVLCAFISTF